MKVSELFKKCIPFLCAGILLRAAGAQAELPRYSLSEPAEFSIIEGKISLEHDAGGYISPGSVTFTGLESNRALISVGDRFDVLSGKSYNISTWITPPL